ncbi:MAG: YqgE/AlgH family protein [Gammaproteobacteria bacterium]|nr:YqgE/AlgH family protein [Gammaproteobacteria bacterium]
MYKTYKNFFQGVMLLLLAIGFFSVPYFIEKWGQANGIAGQLLIASDKMQDGEFDEAVIYVVRHDPVSAMGIIINRVDLMDLPSGFLNEASVKTEISSGNTGGFLPAADYELTSDNEKPNSASEEATLGTVTSATKIRIMNGGPVEYKEEGYYILHSLDVMTEDSQPIEGTNLALTKGVELLKMDEKPSSMLLARGYAGWGPQQLDTEIEQGKWYVKPYQKNLVFTGDKDNLWEGLSGIINSNTDDTSSVEVKIGE